MTAYRCYFLDSKDHIQARTDIEADALGDAIEKALELLKVRTEHYGIEIWLGWQKLYHESREETAPACPQSSRQQNHLRLMPRYRVHFVDNDEKLYDVVKFEKDNDGAAIVQAHRINVPSIGGRFEVWRDSRLCTSTGTDRP